MVRCKQCRSGLEQAETGKSQGIYPMFSQVRKTKYFHLSLLVIAGLLVTACGGPLSIGQKPIEELSPEEAAERAESEARDKDWEIRTQGGTQEYMDDSFIFQKGGGYGGPSGANSGLASLFFEDDKSGGGGSDFGPVCMIFLRVCWRRWRKQLFVARDTGHSLLHAVGQCRPVWWRYIDRLACNA